MTATSRPYDLLLWLGLAVVTVLMSRYSDIDWRVASYFHGAEAGGFPLRNDAFWVTAHSLTRQLSTALWVSLLLFTLHRGHSQRNSTVFKAGSFILLASLTALAVNGLLKTHSAHSCPWSLTAFGGQAEFFHLLDPIPLNPGSGGCLPSGHAAVGFMWWPVVYACARWRPALTHLAFIVVLTLGAACGYIQIVRGAHFVSHVLMTAAVTGACSSIAFHACGRMRFWQRPAIPTLLS